MFRGLSVGLLEILDLSFVKVRLFRQIIGRLIEFSSQRVEQGLIVLLHLGSVLLEVGGARLELGSQSFDLRICSEQTVPCGQMLGFQLIDLAAQSLVLVCELVFFLLGFMESSLEF